MRKDQPDAAFEEVINVLKARRDEHDRASADLAKTIALLEAQRPAVQTVQFYPPPAGPTPVMPNAMIRDLVENSPQGSVPFNVEGLPNLNGLTIGEACAVVVKHARVPITVRDILNTFKFVGYEVRGDAANNIGSALWNRAKPSSKQDVAKSGSRHWVYRDPTQPPPTQP